MLHAVCQVPAPWRDLAVEGCRALREAPGPDAPAAFHRAAAALVRPRVAEWRRRWRRGALAAAEATGRHLEQLAEGDATHLAEAVVQARQPFEEGRFGMCGRLDVYGMPL